MSEIHPPFYGELGPAPTGVCSRWMGDSPCGAAATHHVIWDVDFTNGAMCASHVGEARERWTWIGLHSYTEDCVAFTQGRAEWDATQDRCVTPSPDVLREIRQAHEVSA